MNSKQLKSRWTKSLIGTIAPQIYIFLSGGTGQIAGIDTVEHEGVPHVDLRGFPFDKKILDCAIKNIDFSHCQFSATTGFGRVRADSCRFVDATFEGVISGEFVSCNFRNCTFSNTTFMKKSKFINCIFDESVFRGGDIIGCTFEECSFVKCNMPKLEFHECQFVGCQFMDSRFKSGSVGGCVFSLVKNNFLYVDPYNVEIKKEFVADPSFATVDLVETSTVNTVFMRNEHT